MNEPLGPQENSRSGRVAFTLNPWLQIFLTIIAGTIVAVIAWTVIERFLHILVLLLASFLLAYLLGPIVERVAGNGMPRVLAILLVYLLILLALGAGLVLLVGPLTGQLQGLTDTLPTLVDTRAPWATSLDQFFREHGVAINVTDLRNRLVDYIAGAGTQLLGGTLTFIAGFVTFITDLLLILAITFYLLLDGRAMHNRALRLLPTTTRERWFFVEATLNKVLGGYIRGQLIVALTVGVAAGVGSFLLGVNYPLVIGLLAFLFEFIPMIGPVLGMVPAVVIAFFQSPTLALWVVVYFIVLQQVESNVIVPRVSGHAVGLHPLAALLALLAGFEIGGLGGALLAVPIAGVLYVLVLAIYSDVTSQSELLVTQPRQTAYDSLRNVIGRRREPRTGKNIVPLPMGAGSASGPDGSGRTSGIAATSREDAPAGPTTSQVSPVSNDRLASIAQDQAQLIARFEADEKEQEQAIAEAEIQQEARVQAQAEAPPSEEEAPGSDKISAGEVP